MVSAGVSQRRTQEDPPPVGWLASSVVAHVDAAAVARKRSFKVTHLMIKNAVAAEPDASPLAADEAPPPPTHHLPRAGK